MKSAKAGKEMEFNTCKSISMGKLLVENVLFTNKQKKKERKKERKRRTFIYLILKTNYDTM